MSFLNWPVYFSVQAICSECCYESLEFLEIEGLKIAAISCITHGWCSDFVRFILYCWHQYHHDIVIETSVLLFSFHLQLLHKFWAQAECGLFFYATATFSISLFLINIKYITLCLNMQYILRLNSYTKAYKILFLKTLDKLASYFYYFVICDSKLASDGICWLNIQKNHDHRICSLLDSRPEPGLVNVVVIWNTVYLTRTIDHKRQTAGLDNSQLKHISPLNWNHIQLYGKYCFNESSSLDVDQYRELRLPESSDNSEDAMDLLRGSS